MKTLDWLSQAACKGKTDLFYGPLDEKVASRRVREKQAIAICSECPVILQCRMHARDTGELGVWGGEGEEERYRSGFISDVYVRRRIRMRENRANRRREETPTPR